MTRATKTILICDDDQGMRDTLTAILKRDYRVLTVSSGEAALALMLDPASRVVKKVAVPEGWRWERTVAAAAKATGLSEDALRESLSRAGSLGLPAYAEGNPEGFLFPATYDFARRTTSA